MYNYCGATSFPVSMSMILITLTGQTLAASMFAFKSFSSIITSSITPFPFLISGFLFETIEALPSSFRTQYSGFTATHAAAPMQLSLS